MSEITQTELNKIYKIVSHSPPKPEWKPMSKEAEQARRIELRRQVERYVASQT